MEEKKILIVDDEEEIRDLFDELFSRLGYETRLAEDGKNALEILENEDIHVMFLDLNMPGMSGMELCINIRKDKPNVFIYAVTGYSDKFKPEEFTDAGFNDVFTKPADLQVLIDAAKDAFEKLAN